MNDHLDEVLGVENFHKAPFFLQISDVIQSSVLTHLEHIDHAQLARLWAGKDIGSVFDAGAPGSFNIPVCIRDNENWNSQTKPYNIIFDDYNPWSSKKTLPCYCGNEWGGSTAHVWQESGLARLQKNKDYRTKKCPALIEKKLQSKLEQFIAKCQLDIHYKNFLSNFMIYGYEIGKDHFCDYAIDVVTRHGHGDPHHLDPKMRTALECKLGLYDGVTTTKKSCDRFYAENEKILDEKLRGAPMGASEAAAVADTETLRSNWDFVDSDAAAQ